MKGGAIPVLVWGVILTVLGAINWIWTGDAIQVGTFGFAILVILGGAALAVLLYPPAIKPGPPELRGEPEAIPEDSVGAVVAGLSVASIMFGFVFGMFFVLFGIGMLIASLGRIAIEARAQRRSERAARERQA